MTNLFPTFFHFQGRFARPPPPLPKKTVLRFKSKGAVLDFGFEFGLTKFLEKNLIRDIIMI